MMTISEVSNLTGVSARALRYYDRLGLLKPDDVTEAGYRLYGAKSLERLQQILLFRELEFPLKEIKRILGAPGFDRNCALQQQIELLTLKKEHLENLIALAAGIKGLGIRTLDFSAFDTRRIDEYAKRAKEAWGESDTYKEFEERAKHRTKRDDEAAAARIQAVVEGFGKLVGGDPGSGAAQRLVAELRSAIDENFYICTPEILRLLGRMYEGDGEFAASLDEAGGPGTAQFAAKAVELYCDMLGSP